MIFETKKYILLFLLNFFIYSQQCPPADTVVVVSEQNDWTISSLNSWNHLEIMTWNIKNYPLNQNTLNDVQEVIYDLLPDVINFQELNSQDVHDALETILPAYEFILSDYDPYYGLDIAIKKDCINLLSYEKLFNENGYEFAWRYPLSANLVWFCGDEFLEFEMINVHFKCCDNGFERRLASSEILSDYIDFQTQNNKNIIVAGDYNDSLDDLENNNSLLPLINNENIEFVDFQIAEGSTFNWSYPSYPSHIDHILVNELLMNNTISLETNTLRIDDFTGYSYYQNNISDHRPVYLKISITSPEIPQGLVINEIMNNPTLENEALGEWFELTNIGSQPIDIFGLKIIDNDFDFHNISEHVIINPNEYIVLGSSSSTEQNGNIDIDYQYENFNLSNLWDEIIILHSTNIVLDEVIYSSQSFPSIEGKSMMLIKPDLDNSLSTNWIESSQEIGNGDFGTPGSSNNDCQANGDLNQDYITNILDVVLLVGYILGNNIFTILQECNADINQDNTINVVDIVLVVAYILN